MYRIAATALMVVAFAGIARAAEYEVHPSLIVGEEYTDNVFETNDNRVSDFITRTRPGIAMALKSPRLDAKLSYAFDYRYYARRSRGTDTTHDLSATGHLTVVNNLFFVDVTDTYQRISLDVTRNVTSESLFLNQTDSNTLTATPYFLLHLTDRTVAKTGYRLTDIRYFTSQADDRMTHTGYVELTHELSSRWSITSGYTFSHEDAVTDGYDQHQAYAGLRYEYAEKSFVFGQGGYTWTRYVGGARLNSPYWNAGLTHAFDTVTVTLKSGVSYDEDPLHNIIQDTYVSGDLEKRLLRGSLGLSLYYAEYTQVQSDALQTRKYGGIARARYDFTPHCTGRLSFTAEKYDQKLLDSYTRRFIVESGIDFLLTKELTLALSHYFVDYYSPGIATDNYEVNRGIVELKLAF